MPTPRFRTLVPPLALFASVLFVFACEPKEPTQAPTDAGAATVDPAAEELAQRLAYLEQRLEQARVDSHVPGMAIAIVKDGEMIYAHGFGVSDLDASTPVTPETVFAIGSSTKAFSSTLAAMMVDEGKLDWDDPVTKHLPDFDLQIDGKEGEVTTIRDLLAHRTGFARMGVLWAGGSVPREEVLGYATKAKPVAPFRAEFHYNNVTYMAGAVAAAKAAGMSWEQMVEARLLEPLHMDHSTLDYASAQADPNFSKGYSWREDLGEFKLAPMRNVDVIGPAGSINSSVVDMSNWLRLQLAEGEFEGERLVSAAALAETHTKQSTVAPGAIDYGMGWMLREWEGRAVVEHGGNIDGFAASVALLPEEELGMVLLTNASMTGLQGTAHTLVWEALLTDAYLPKDPSAQGEDFSRFIGEYVSTIPGMSENMEVLVQDGKLAVDVPGQMVYTLVDPDEDEWRYFEATDTVAVSFDEGPEGEIVALRLHQGGMSFELLREGVELEPEVRVEDVRPFLGNYRAENGMTAEVLISHGRLAVNIPGQMIYELELPEGSDYHFRVNYEFFANFVLGKDKQAGKVLGLTVFQPGTTTTFERQGEVESVTLEQIHAKRKTAKRAKAMAKAGEVRFAQKVELINAGASGTGELWFDAAGQLHEHVEFGPLGEAKSTVYAGGAWRESSFEPREVLEGALLDQARLSHPQVLFGDWREFYDSETLLRTEARKEGEVYVIELRKEGLPPAEVVVDAKSGDVIEVRSTELTSKGMRSAGETTLSDYRSVKGMRVPFMVESTTAHSGTTRVTLLEVERNQPGDPGRYVAMPSE